jgi:lysophospholipase L1-like esterase
MYIVGCLGLLMLSSCKRNTVNYANVEPNTSNLKDTVLVMPVSAYPDSTLSIAAHSDFTKKHYPERIATFKQNPLDYEAIVFLGNSITEQGGDWALKLGIPKAFNRGISGDTTEGVLARLGEIIYSKPAKVFILIGINDLFHKEITPQQVHNNIIEIVNKIHSGSPNTEVYVQTILPTSTPSINKKVRLTNTRLVLSEKSEPYTLIKLYNHFVADDELLNMNLTEDGVHLNVQGYALWKRQLKSIFN